MEREHIIIRYLTGEASEKEINEMMEWMKKDKSFRKEFTRLKNIWFVSGIGKEKQLPELEKEFLSLRRKIIRYNLIKSSRYLWFRRIAVILLIPLTVTITLLLSNRIPDKKSITYSEIQVPGGEKSHVILPDGSAVWLNSQSKLKYSSRFGDNNREVILEGEAFFEVTSNPRKPFLVETELMDIEVLGTKFNVSAYPDDEVLETTLITGEVKIGMKKDKSGLSEEIIIKPDQKAIYIKKQKSVQIKEVNSKLSYSWTLGEYVFQNERLGNITKRIERWYNVEIKFLDEELKDQRLSGRFRDNEPIRQIIDVLKLTTPIKYTIKENIILIEKRN